MRYQKEIDKRINQYGTIGFYIFLIALVYSGSFFAIYGAYNFEVGNNDFTNGILAFSTSLSAVGLIWFSYLTYKNQQNNEFYSLFKVLLDEHNSLLQEVLTLKKNSLFKLNKNIIILFGISINIFQEYNENLEKDFNKNLNTYINYEYELKPYLIILFRLLKIISTSTRINANDKTECFGLIKGLIPPDIQFIILFNSLLFREECRQLNYTNLLIESKFFEHLPITNRWLDSIYSKEIKDSSLHNPYDETPDKKEKVIYELKQYITSGNLIDLKAFGESIYLD